MQDCVWKRVRLKGLYTGTGRQMHERGEGGWEGGAAALEPLCPSLALKHNVNDKYL